MGKIKTVIMGDTETEEAARKKAEAKREQKKARTSKTVNQLTSESVTGKEAPTDLPGQKVKKKAKVDVVLQALYCNKLAPKDEMEN